MVSNNQYLRGGDNNNELSLDNKNDENSNHVRFKEDEKQRQQQRQHHSHFISKKRFSLVQSTEEINKIKDNLQITYSSDSDDHHNDEGGKHENADYVSSPALSNLVDTTTINSDETGKFYGSYIDIRKQLDYDYHSCYTKERQFLQDTIVGSLVMMDDSDADDEKQDIDEQETTEEETSSDNEQHPWIIFVAGPYYSGKSDATNKLVDTGYLPISSSSTGEFVRLHKHDIRRHLPEFDTYVKLLEEEKRNHNQGSSEKEKDELNQTAHELKTPETERSLLTSSCYEKIIQLTDKEADYIMEISIKLAMKHNKNIVVDTATIPDLETWFGASISSSSSLSSRSSSPLLSFVIHQYKIALLHVTAPHDNIIQNLFKKSLDADYDGLAIPRDVLKEQYEQIPKYVHDIVNRTKLDFFCEVIVDTSKREAKKDSKNSSDNSVGISITKPTDMDWTKFHQNFQSLKNESITTNLSHYSTTLSDDSKILTIHGVENNDSDTLPKDHYRYRRFSYLKSTEENYKTKNEDEEFKFVGPYANIRETLDYSYHENYTVERQKLQDAIITDMLNTTIIKDKNNDKIICTTPTEPFIVFTAGAMGAGKSWVMNKLVERGRFPLLAFVLVDPDEVRRHFPEFHIYIQTNPLLAGELTRKEAGFVCEILTMAALQAGKNVLVDGSLRDHGWYSQYFVELRKQFPELRLAIIHITAPREAIFKRAAARAQQTGRIVPEKTLVNAMEQVPKSVGILKEQVDYFAELNNSLSSATGDNIELVHGGDDWDEFEQHWQQACKYIMPNRRNFLKGSKQSNEKLAISGKKTV